MQAPADGVEALCAVRPRWTRVGPARACLRREGRWLLHAGPPLADPARLPAPLLASAVLACRHEGWAAADDEAERLVVAGEISLLSAQSVRCATPLAALVSPSTAMVVVEDGAGLVAPTFAPLGATAGADLRFGTRDPRILERLRRREEVEAVLLAAALDLPIDLLEIARQAVALGDDLHNRTAAATRVLRGILAQRGIARAREGDALLHALDDTPLYFLTVWMAAAKLMLSAAEGRAPASLVTAMGGNGADFGIQLAGAPGRWCVRPADPPAGPRLPQASPAATVLGAIGDSAVIDALGFGGQALARADEPLQSLRAHLPTDPGAVARALLVADHPCFAGLGIRVGMDARRIVEQSIPPIVTLGMVEATGTGGLLGRGVCRPSLALCQAALRLLDTGVALPRRTPD